MLTTEQLALLKADIEADPMFSGWYAEDRSPAEVAGDAALVRNVRGFD